MKKIKIFVLLIATVQLTACIDTEKNKLENRATDYWTYKVNKEFKKAYEFLTPGWRKTEKVESYELRMLNSRITWTGNKFKSKECTKPDFCKVSMEISYNFISTIGSKRVMELSDYIVETWVLKDNKWYQLPIHKKLM